jgi:hypothetical protein
VTDEQRWSGEKAVQPRRRGRYGLSAGVARSSPVTSDMLLTRALPASPQHARAVWLSFSIGS